MITKTIYIAKDGKKFDSEDLCAIYEQELDIDKKFSIDIDSWNTYSSYEVLDNISFSLREIVNAFMLDPIEYSEESNDARMALDKISNWLKNEYLCSRD